MVCGNDPCLDNQGRGGMMLIVVSIMSTVEAWIPVIVGIVSYYKNQMCINHFMTSQMYYRSHFFFSHVIILDTNN